MKHFNLRPMAAAFLFFVLTAALTGCGQKADEVMSLTQEETAADGASGTLTSDGQATSAEAENAGSSQEQAASEADGSENAGASDEGGDTGIAETSEDTEAMSDAKDECMAVYICGAVVTPGVYDVTEDMRLISLVELAGGFAAGADETYWNLAQKLDDGAMYYIPTAEETADENFILPTGESDTAAGSQNTAESVSSGSAGSGNSDSGQAGEQTESSGGNSGTDGLISINTATQDELTALPGIGATKAAAIVTYRETNGPFTALDEIMNVTGIGESTYEKLKDYICL